MKHLIQAFSLLLTISAFGAETDHFTDAEKVLPDESQVINNLANSYVLEVLAEQNAETNCDDSLESEKRLYTLLKKYFANHSKGVLAKELLKGELVATNVIPLKQSVYQNWSIGNGFLLGRKKAAQSPLALAPMIRVGEQKIGTDKLEHMFGMGFRYFSSHYLKGKSIEKVLKNGILKEKTILGGNVLATGVFSYADLAANFNGMRFWNHMLQRRDDILGKAYNLGPYIECRNNKWVAVKAIDFRDYVDASMDESINCSNFANRKGLRKFQAAIKEIDPANTCPMNPELRSEMIFRYQNLSHWIINEESNGVVSWFNEF